jgi:hypothetical protein
VSRRTSVIVDSEHIELPLMTNRMFKGFVLVVGNVSPETECWQVDGLSRHRNNGHFSGALGKLRRELHDVILTDVNVELHGALHEILRTAGG